MWTTDPPSLTVIGKSRKPELTKICESLGLGPEGTVAELRERLRSHLHPPQKDMRRGRFRLPPLALLAIEGAEPWAVGIRLRTYMTYECGCVSYETETVLITLQCSNPMVKVLSINLHSTPELSRERLVHANLQDKEEEDTQRNGIQVHGRWTKKELSLTKSLLEKGRSFEEVSEALGHRTPGAVGFKAVKFGLMTREELDEWYQRTRKERDGERWKKRRGQHQFRAQVFERDGHQCTVCMSKKELTAHHIIAFRKVKKHELQNGITLCKRCHGVITRGRWKKPYPYPATWGPWSKTKARRERWIQETYVSVIEKRGFRASIDYCKGCKKYHTEVAEAKA